MGWVSTIAQWSSQNQLFREGSQVVLYIHLYSNDQSRKQSAAGFYVATLRTPPKYSKYYKSSDLTEHQPTDFVPKSLKRIDYKLYALYFSHLIFVSRYSISCTSDARRSRKCHFEETWSTVCRQYGRYMHHRAVIPGGWAVTCKWRFLNRCANQWFGSRQFICSHVLCSRWLSLRNKRKQGVWAENRFKKAAILDRNLRNYFANFLDWRQTRWRVKTPQQVEITDAEDLQVPFSRSCALLAPIRSFCSKQHSSAR